MYFQLISLHFRTCSLESSGAQKSLVFSIVPGTDAVALLWKPQVRVKCCKVSYLIDVYTNFWCGNLYSGGLLKYELGSYDPLKLEK